MVEPVETCDWMRWTPEIEVGIEGASTDMAASYARRAAIEFAEGARVLRRVIALTLRPGNTRIPLFPFEGERVVGLINVKSATSPCGCPCGRTGSYVPRVGVVQLRRAQQELAFTPVDSCFHGKDCVHLLVEVAAAPTEDACDHDSYLYEQYRSDIALGARAMMIKEAHAVGTYKTYRGTGNFRGDAMLMAQAEKDLARFRKAIKTAQVDAVFADQVNTSAMPIPAGGVYGSTGGCWGCR